VPPVWGKKFRKTNEEEFDNPTAAERTDNPTAAERTDNLTSLQTITVS
jgi:hypothetical protein